MAKKCCEYATFSVSLTLRCFLEGQDVDLAFLTRRAARFQQGLPLIVAQLGQNALYLLHLMQLAS